MEASEYAAEIVDWCDVVTEMNSEGKTEEEMLSSLTYMEAPQWALDTLFLSRPFGIIRSNRLERLIRTKTTTK